MRLSATAIVAFALLLGEAGSAYSHSKLMSASPAKDSIVSGTLKQVKLGFSEAIEPALSYFELLDPEKKRLVRTSGKDACTDKICQFAVKALPDGEYRVRYHVLSGDGHVVEGDYGFTVKNAQ